MLITPQEAISHARLDSDYPEAQVVPYILAAGSAASQFLQREIFATEADLAAALAAYPSNVSAAHAAYEVACAQRDAIEDLAQRNAAGDVAWLVFNNRMRQLAAGLEGVVITPDIKAAILLLFAHLFENRQENVTGTIVTELKTGVHALLWPHRIELGV